MKKKLTPIDYIMLGLAFASLIYAELMWFNGNKDSAIFVGIWVPSILGFAAYLKLLKMEK